jgi:zinc protease
MLSLGALGGFTAAPLCAEEAVPAEIDASTAKLPFRMKTLANGMRVIVSEDRSAPIAAVQVWYHVGSKDENPERQGFAHMFEHMMFRGTGHTSDKDHFEFIRSVGGDNNAYTSFDNTTYIQKVPASQVEMVLWLESERMAFLEINDRNFQVERKVVEEERRVGLERPYGDALEKLLPQMFTTHPYRWTPIGNIPALRAATSAELQQFWETYYVPNNATLVVVGDVNSDDIFAMAEKYFGWMPRGADPPRVTVREPEQTAPREFRIKVENGPVPIVGIAYFAPEVGHPDGEALSILMTVLGGGESSRVYRALVDEKRSAMVAMGGAFSLEQAGIAGVGAVLAPLGDTRKALADLQAEIERIRRDGITEEELEKARNQALLARIAQLSSVESKASALGNAAVIEGDPRRVNSSIDRIRAVTLEDVKRVANTYLADSRRNEITIESSIAGFLFGKMVKPKAQEEEAPVAQSPEGARFGGGKPGLERPEFYGEKPPVAEMRLAFDYEKPKTVTLDNGLRVVIAEDSEIPLVTYTLGVRYGAFADPAGAPGTASAAASTITRGTENYTYKAFTDLTDRHAISVGASASLDSTTVTASAMTEFAPLALELMAEVVRRPTFPKEEFTKFIDQQKTGLAISEASPEEIARRILRERIYGTHPYARTASGLVKDQDKLTADGARQWWYTYVRPDRSVLYIAGDVDREDVLALVKKHFGDWGAEGKAPKVALPEIPRPEDTTIYLVDKKAAGQAQIAAGHLGITRASKDYPYALIAGQAFGGSFGSRLNETIRVQKGLTYGAFGGFSASRFAGQFTVGTFTKTDKAPETVEVLLGEVDRLLDQPLDDKEVRSAKNYILGSWGVQRETPQDRIADWWLIESNDLPADYFKTLMGRVSKASPRDVARAMRRLVHPDKLSVIVVGDAAALKARLEKLAPVTVLNEKGEVIGQKKEASPLPDPAA